jgi:hypothetical protein
MVAAERSRIRSHQIWSRSDGFADFYIRPLLAVVISGGIVFAILYFATRATTRRTRDPADGAAGRDTNSRGSSSP